MNRPKVRIHNTETNEIIDREMNDAEYAQYLKDVETHRLTQEQIKETKTAKAALLDRLGITEAEAKLLLS